VAANRCDPRAQRDKWHKVDSAADDPSGGQFDGEAASGLNATADSVVLNVIPFGPLYAPNAAIFDAKSIDSNVSAINIRKRITMPLAAEASRAI
jgi:hypothetical protein